MSTALARKRWQRSGPEMAAWVRVLWRDPCAYCGGPGGTVDHITAVYCGGRAEPSNLTGACPRCNLDKGAMQLLDFLL